MYTFILSVVFSCYWKINLIWFDLIWRAVRAICCIDYWSNVRRGGDYTDCGPTVSLSLWVCLCLRVCVCVQWSVQWSCLNVTVILVDHSHVHASNIKPLVIANVFYSINTHTFQSCYTCAVARTLARGGLKIREARHPKARWVLGERGSRPLPR